MSIIGVPLNIADFGRGGIGSDIPDAAASSILTIGDAVRFIEKQAA